MRPLLLAAALILCALLPASADEKLQWRIERVWDPAQGESRPISPEAAENTSGGISVFGKLTVETGCNTVFARGLLTGSKIKFGTPWATKKACEGEARAIEAGLVEALTLARIYEDPRRRIILRDAGGKEVLALVKR
jgi:heat shock protein HslJ